MRTKTITLPNGFSRNGSALIREVEIRKLGGPEEDLLVDKEELKKGGILFTILKQCTISMGGITDPRTIALIYDTEFLLADLTYVLVELRSWGIDPQYTFEHQCPVCDNIGKHVIDLGTLRVDEQKKEFRGLDRYMTVLKDAPKPFNAVGEPLPEKDWTYGDVPFSFRPLYTRDQKMLEAIKSDYPKEKVTREMFLQIIDYDGFELDVKTLRAFDSGTRSGMRNAVDATSGGVDTEVIMTCKKCSKTYKDGIPVEVKHFFFRAGASPQTTKATPFREDGTTLTSWLSGSTGPQAKSEPSISKSEPST